MCWLLGELLERRRAQGSQEGAGTSVPDFHREKQQRWEPWVCFVYAYDNECGGQGL